MHLWFRQALLLLFMLGTLLVGFAHGQGQQPATPPDCQTQLGLALNRQGTAQTLAREDREALILYFQGELRKVMQERDEARKQLEDTKKTKEPG